MMRTLRRWRFVFVAVLLTLVLASTGWSFAAENIVEPSLIGSVSIPVSAEQLKPPQCAALNLTNYIVITGNGAIHGTDGNDLIIGSPGKDTIHAGGGDDCIVGGGGGDQFFGDAGNDVCIGSGDSKDKFHDCEVVVP